jgi:hypothetical protein
MWDDAHVTITIRVYGARGAAPLLPACNTGTCAIQPLVPLEGAGAGERPLALSVDGGARVIGHGHGYGER